MGGTSSFFISVGIAAGLMLAAIALYHLMSIANSIYTIKVDLQREVETRLTDIKEYVEKELAQRTLWIRNDAIDSVNRLRKDIDAQMVDDRRELQAVLAQMRKQIAVLELSAGIAGDEPPVPAAKPKPKAKG